MNITKNNHQEGFSLIELLIYVIIFSVSSVFLVTILTSVTQIHVREKSANEVNHQIGFIASTIERLVEDSSSIDISAGAATSTLILRMASSSLDTTKVYASGTLIFLEEGTSTPVALTDSKVKVDNFSVVKYENPGSRSIVHVNLALSYNTDNAKGKFSRAIQLATARISAATFDASVLPNASNNYDLGSASYQWRDAYFGGNVGIGVAPNSSFRLLTTGDVAVSTSSKGLILTSPNNTCYRISVSNAGALSTATTTCP